MLGLGLNLWQPAVYGGAAAAVSGAALLAAGETQALALDFTDDFYEASTGLYGSAYVLDTGTPANNYSSHPYGILTYTSPSLKMTMGPTGTLRFGAHNLATYSQDAQGVGHVLSGTVASSATRLTVDSSSGAHNFATASIAVISGAVYTFSMEIKPVNDTWVQLFLGAAAWGTTNWINFDLTGAGSTGNTGGALVSSSIELLSDGYYRCTISATSGATTSAPAAFSFTNNSNTVARSPSFATGGVSAVDLRNIHFRRTPSDDTYLATTSAARYALPYEWDTSGNPLGILVEEARTNLSLYSNTFSNAAWSKDRATVTQGQTSPTGDADAWLFAEDATAANSHIMYQSITWTAAAHTFSMFAKVPASNARNWIYLVTWDGSVERGKFFNISTGAEGASIGSPTSTGITPLGGGLYRCWITLTPAAASGNFQIGLASADNTRTYDGDGVSGCIVYGADVEAGSFPTSYIPTLGSTVTRAADNISLATSEFPTAASMTLFGRGRRADDTSLHVIAALATDGSNWAGIRRDSTAGQLIMFRAGGLEAAPSAAGWTQDAFIGVAGRFVANDTQVCIAGTLGTADVSCTPPTYTELRVGDYAAGFGNFNGHISHVLVVPRGVSDGDLPTFGAVA